MKNKIFFKQSGIYFALALTVTFLFTRCDKDDDDDNQTEDKEVTAVFSYAAEALTITFTNASVNGVTYAWDFGDGNSSTEENPKHTYEKPGIYEVKLTASNPTYSNDVTQEVLTQNAGAIASKIVGKTWMAARGNVWCYALGPQDQGDFQVGKTWFDQSPPWWGWGDADGQDGGWAQLEVRPSLYNDKYTFNVDGSYTVDFGGDFWGEYGLWTGTDSDEKDITIGSGLPKNANGDDMTAFASGKWEFVVDEDKKTIKVIGKGAHILSPRVANGGKQITTPADECTYDVIRVVEGSDCDTLVILGKANDGTNDIAQYITLHSYHEGVEIPKVLPLPCSIKREGTVAAAKFAHTFTSKDGFTGMATINADYTFDYGVTMGGEICTKVDIQNDGAPYGNIMLRAGTSGTCEAGTEKYVDAITFDNQEYVVKFDIYIPKDGNDFAGTALENLVTVRWVDESQYNQFWEHYLYIDKKDLALDQWVALEYDFSTNADAIYVGDNNAKHSLSELITAGSNVPDALHIDFGGDNHKAAGTFYIKNVRLEAAVK